MAAPLLRFYLADLLTGQILTQLPLTGLDKITRVIAREDQQTFSLATADPACPDDWASLLEPGKTMIVLTVDGWPTQAWHVEEPNIGGAEVPIAAVTLETCLRRTNVPDLDGTFDDVEGAVALCAPLLTRFGFTIEHTASGHSSDFDYSNAEDRSLLDVMYERMKGENPVEWRINIRWTDTTVQDAFDKVLEIRPRIGIDRPDAIFDLDANGRGCIEQYSRKRSYAAGKGATMMIGTSEGTGTSRPVTDPIYSALVALGWPVWEERSNFTGLPSGSIEEEVSSLESRTSARLLQRQQGTTSWAIVGNDTAPRPGVDYDEGDTVHLDIAPQGKQDPVGGTATVRALGYELDIHSGQATVIVWEEDDDS